MRNYKKRSKYGVDQTTKGKQNRTVIDRKTEKEVCFDSLLEKRFYEDIICAGLDSGEIVDYELQKKYKLQPSFRHNGKTIRAIDYVADFWVKYSDGSESYNYLQEKYSDDQKQFIIDNYKTMTDIELSEALDKPLSGIQEQRRKLGIYYLNKDYSGYDNLSKFFRGHIQDWKNASMKACNYQCILTGSKDFIIHHKYGFNKILQEAFEKMDEQNLLKSTNLSDYSFEELSSMLDIFQCIHNKYPLGVCIRKDIHDLFHQLYGSGGNTEEQWESFIAKYSNKLTA